MSVVAESLWLTRPLKKEPKVNANFEILPDITSPDGVGKESVAP